MYNIVNNDTGKVIGVEEDYGNAAELWNAYDEMGYNVSMHACGFNIVGMKDHLLDAPCGGKAN